MDNITSKAGQATRTFVRGVTQGVKKAQNLPNAVLSTVDNYVGSTIGADGAISQFTRLGRNSAAGSSFKTKQSSPLGAPKQKQGLSQSTERERKYKTEAEAKVAFRQASEKLLRPGSWDSDQVGLTYVDTPKWSLLNSNGKEERKSRRAEKGDVLKIKSPGGTFFVEVDRAKAGKDNVEFTVRPTRDPASQKKNHVDHFFDNGSSRTFSLQRDGKELRFVTVGRNERPNWKAGWESPGNLANSAIITAGGGEAYWWQFSKNLLGK